jgi:hypothetical protein
MHDRFFQIRATRASPPGLAADPKRHAVYTAALAQFEELMTAAASASAASRPLPLFYALSQAGRAITAAHGGDTWRMRMHGLQAPHLDGDVLNVAVRVDAKSKGDTVDSFTGIVTATQSTAPTAPATLGELWASIPSVADLLPDPSRPRPLRAVTEENSTSHMFVVHSVRAHLVGIDLESAEEVRTLLSGYPMAAGAVLEAAQSICPWYEYTDWGEGLRVMWPGEITNIGEYRATVDYLMPFDPASDARWLHPAAGGVHATPIVAWWMLLFGLSMLARYEPAGWATALDLDRSLVAAALRELLDRALGAVPEVVFSALMPR